MAILTEEEFSKHVGTEFCADFGEQKINLTLAEVKPYTVDQMGDKNMERFSLFFEGPPDLLIPQQSVPLRHEAMGEMEVFLVPIRGDANAFRYEAVFNFYK